MAGSFPSFRHFRVDRQPSGCGLAVCGGLTRYPLRYRRPDGRSVGVLACLRHGSPSGRYLENALTESSTFRIIILPDRQCLTRQSPSLKVSPAGQALSRSAAWPSSAFEPSCDLRAIELSLLSSLVLLSLVFHLVLVFPLVPPSPCRPPCPCFPLCPCRPPCHWSSDSAHWHAASV